MLWSPVLEGRWSGVVRSVLGSGCRIGGRLGVRGIEGAICAECRVWLLVLSACGRGCVGGGCCGLVDNRIGAGGCAALARALEGGAVPQLSKLDLRRT